MKDVDYIIVGLGIAGLTFCEHLLENRKSFIVIADNETPATAVSGGVFNPTVLKRFTLAWQGMEFYKYSLEFYNNLQSRLDTTFIDEKPIFRIIKSIEEQNDWVVASDKKELGVFLSPKIISNTNKAINTSFGFGKVTNTATINTELLLQKYGNDLQKNGKLISEKFQYEELRLTENGVIYKTLSAQKIIFTEGAAVIKNPFFKKELLVPNKGEYLIIKARDLKLKSLLKGPLFIIPLGEDCYKVGATYSSNDYSNNITDAARIEILRKLETMINCDYNVIDHIAGVRPTTKDRRPLLGAFPENKNIIFFNGLGTRGIIGAPWLAKTLCNSIINNTDLPSEVNINRFS